MYLQQEKKKPKTSLLRVALLAIVIVGLSALIRFQPEWAKPFEPTPEPTLSAAYFLNQGNILQAEGNLPDAYDAYQTAISLNPGNDLPYREQAYMLVHLGDPAGAVSKAESAVLRDPNNPDNLAGYCQALDWEGRYADAYQACECAIELDPNHSNAYAFLAEVHADQGYWGVAREAAQTALDLDFQNANAHHNMGYAYEVQGRYKQALEFFENALVLKPNLAAFYMAAGRNYYWAGQLNVAVDRFADAIKLAPYDPATYDQLGWTYHGLGQDDRAIDALSQAISVDPNYTRAWGHLGTIYYLRQNYENAIDILQTAIELSEAPTFNNVRGIDITTQISGEDGPETVVVLTGNFKHDFNAPNISAIVAPVQWTEARPFDDKNTCGDLIARNIRNQIIQVSPNQDISFSLPFSTTIGDADLDLSNGELTLTLSDVPKPQSVPYEVLLRYKSGESEVLGYIQPNSNQSIKETLQAAGEQTNAPVEYYYELGLSYAYLSEDQCDLAVPWLLKALEVDSAYYNPAWAGLRICPSADSPPTPLPTFTPTPDPEDAG